MNTMAKYCHGERNGAFMKKRYDAVIVGAGYAGSVCARVLSEGGRRVLLLDRRDHVGGNAYDEYDESEYIEPEYKTTIDIDD